MKRFIPVILLIMIAQYAVHAQPVLSLTPVISTGLSSPIQLVNAGDGTGRIFIVQKEGTVLLFDKNYALIDTFLTVTGIVTDNERGLLSLAFHPGFATNGFFYVYYDNSNGDLELARYHISANANVADAASKVILITIPHPNNGNHNGGTLQFGPEGDLYLSTGDGGGAGDQPNNAQTTTILLGKILRFAVNTSSTAPYYTIPADNPFGNEVFDLGLRNPFRWSFDRLTHDMWIGDVGQDSYEEVNFRPADSTRGNNFGWHCYEGNVTYNNTTTGCGGPLSSYTFPVYTYPTPNPSGAITGGTVYRGNTYIAFRGYYVAVDFFTANFILVKYDSLTHTIAPATTQSIAAGSGISNFGLTEDGEMYAVSLTQNIVYRISTDGAIGYTFTGNGNWDIADNWTNKTIPPATLPAGAEIIIDPVSTGECLLNIQQTVAAGASLTVKPGKKFRIPGNLVIQ